MLCSCIYTNADGPPKKRETRKRQKEVYPPATLSFLSFSLFLRAFAFRDSQTGIHFENDVERRDGGG
jgi:hypothetical protein